MKHVKIIPGKGLGNDPNDPNDTTNIEFVITDDGKVSGYGMPVTPELCSKMIKDHHDLQTGIYNALDQLPLTDEIQRLKDSVDPNKEITFGIYGRDVFMHLLEQEGCEGIMYISCMYGGKKTIVLTGVDKDGGFISGPDSLKGGTPNVVIYEVKGGGGTRAEINALAG